MEDKVKHLEMITAIIERMAKNSFAMKGWALTLSLAFIAFAGDSDKPYLAILACIPLLSFWTLDAFYLVLERKYRGKYELVVGAYRTDFSMELDNVQPKKKGQFIWFLALFAAQNLFFYGPAMVLIYGIAKFA